MTFTQAMGCSGLSSRSASSARHAEPEDPQMPWANSFTPGLGRQWLLFSAQYLLSNHRNIQAKPQTCDGRLSSPEWNRIKTGCASLLLLFFLDPETWFPDSTFPASLCHLPLASRSSCLFDLKQQTWGIDPPKIHQGPTGIRFTWKCRSGQVPKKHSWLMILVNYGGYLL